MTFDVEFQLDDKSFTLNDTSAAAAEAAADRAESAAETLSGSVAQIATNTQDITALKEDISHIGGLSEDIKQAMLQIAQKVAYIDEHGQDYYDDLYDALYPPADLVSISAVYTQSGTVYDSDTLDSLRSDLVVTATYSTGTSAVVTGYTLSGTLTEGTSTVTVAFGGMTASFSVTVTSNRVTVPWVAHGSSVTHNITDNGDDTYTLNYIGSTTPASDYYQAWAADCSSGDILHLNFNNDAMVKCGCMLYITDSNSIIMKENSAISNVSGNLDYNINWKTSGYGKLIATVTDDSYVTIPDSGKIVILIRGNAYKPDADTAASNAALYTALNNGVFNFFLEKTT